MRAHKARQILIALCVATLAVAAVPAQFGPPPPGSGQTAQAAQVSGTGAISGVVIDGTTKQPIAGAIVQISGGARGAAPQPRIITDSKGRFVFKGLTAFPLYDFTVTTPGYVTSQTRVGDTSDRIPLADGEWISDLVLTMWRLSSISGTIVDEKGEPVVGVNVRALARLPSAGTQHLAAGPITKTDDRGIYRLAGLRPGNYVVMVPSVQAAVPITTPATVIGGGLRALLPSEATPGRGASIANGMGINVGDSRLVIGNAATPPPLGARPQAYPVMFSPGVRSATRAPSIDLAYGEERQGVDFALQPVLAASVSGRVVGPPDARAGFTLRLLVEGAEELGLGHEQATALAAADGSFSFLNVPAGTYTLEAKRAFGELTLGGTGGQALPGTPGLVSASGYVSQVTSSAVGASVMVRQSTGDERYWARQRIEVTAAGASNVTVTLQPTVSVSGRVQFDGPPRQIQVQLLVIEPVDGEGSKGVSRLPLPGLSQGPPAAPDEFAFHGLTDGEYFLRYYWPGMVAKSIMANGIDYADRPFDVSGGDLRGVVVTVTDKLASLSGIVRDRAGAAQSSAAVIAFPADRTMWSRYGFSPPRIKSTLASKQGTYVLQGLPQGEYLVVAVTASQRDAWQDSRFFPAVAGQAARASVDWGATQAVNLTMTDVVLR